jgi:hypothetical protein
MSGAHVPDTNETSHENTTGIRSIDFSNFSYPWTADVGDPKQTFRLIGGEYKGNHERHEVPMHLWSVVYGDVTGDGEDEAIVAIGIVVEGGQRRLLRFTYTLGRMTRLKCYGSFQLVIERKEA